MNASAKTIKMGQNLFNETKKLQINGNLSSDDCLQNYIHALYMCQHCRSKHDEAMIQTYIAKTMNDLGMIQEAIIHCEDSVKIYRKECRVDDKVLQEAENLLQALKFGGMVTEMVGKLTSEEDCLILGPFQRLFD